MNDREILKVVADKAADDLKKMSASMLGLTAFSTELRDAEGSNSKGYWFLCGELRSGRRTYSFEVWRDQFVRFASEKTESPAHFWYGISTRSPESLALIIKNLPKQLQPVHELLPGDAQWDGKTRRVTKPIPVAYDGKVIRESDSDCHYLGVHNASIKHTKANLRVLGTKAADFWRHVLVSVHDVTQVDEVILEGQEITRTTMARTRSARLRARALKHFRPLNCHACGFVTPRILNLRNREIIEFHHKTPVSWHDVNGSKQSLSRALSSLVPLCPTCHRIAHSTPAGSGKLFATADIRRIKKTATEKTFSSVKSLG